MGARAASEQAGYLHAVSAASARMPGHAERTIVDLPNENCANQQFSPCRTTPRIITLVLPADWQPDSEVRCRKPALNRHRVRRRAVSPNSFSPCEIPGRLKNRYGLLVMWGR